MERAIINVDLDLGEAVPEGRIINRLVEMVELINAGREAELCIGQAELVTGLRLAFKRKQIHRNELAFKFRDTLVFVMPDGQQADWPKDFPGDVNDSLLIGILDWNDAMPAGQETPNTAPNLENVHLATDVMTIDIGATVKAGGREWSMEGDAAQDRDPGISPDQKVWFVDVTSPGLDGKPYPASAYRSHFAHIRMTNDVAAASRTRWAQAFRDGAYTLDVLRPSCKMCDWINQTQVHPLYAQERREGPGHTCK